MSHDPIAFFAALREEDEALSDALAAIRAETDAGRITPAEAASERVGVWSGISPRSGGYAAS